MTFVEEKTCITAIWNDTLRIDIWDHSYVHSCPPQPTLPASSQGLLDLWTLWPFQAPLPHQHLPSLLPRIRWRLRTRLTHAFLHILNRRIPHPKRTLAPIEVIARQSTFASRVSVSVRHERISRPRRAVPAASCLQAARALRVAEVARISDILTLHGGHGSAAGGDAGIEAFADLILLSIMAALEADSDQSDQDETDEKGDEHNDPFLQAMSV